MQGLYMLDKTVQSEDRSQTRLDTAVEVLFPGAILLGLLAGLMIFAIVIQLGDIQLGDRMAGIYCASTVCLFALTGIVALAVFFGGGDPNSMYLDAASGDIFLVILLPVGVPVVVGAVLGAGVATAS